MRKNNYQYKILKNISRNEEIQWIGKPNKRCMILESIFNPLLPFALIWAAIDFSFIGAIITIKNFSMLPFIILFFSIHLMPVWIYLGGVLLSGLKFKNTEFAITDKAVYFSSGILSVNVERRNYTQFSNLEIHRGFFDNKLNVGDVNLTSTNEMNSNRRGLRVFSIFDISDFQNVYNILMNNFAQTRINYERYMQNNHINTPYNPDGNIPYYMENYSINQGNTSDIPYKDNRDEQYKDNEEDGERRIDW